MSDLVVHCANSDLNSIATALQTAKIHLIDDTRHGWPWKEILQGAVTLCVGLFADWIAWQQKEIAKENKEISRENKEITKQKLKLEIFEKRMEIVEIIKNFYKNQTETSLFEIPRHTLNEISLYNLKPPLDRPPSKTSLIENTLLKPKKMHSILQKKMKK